MEYEDGYEHTLSKAAVAAQNVKEKEYWLQKLSGQLIKSDFPYGNHRTALKENTAASRDFVEFTLTGELFSRLTRISNESHVRLLMLLVAGVVVLLDKYNYNSHKDIIIGTTIYRQEVEGNFINTILALRNQLDDHSTFRQLLSQVKETLIQAMDNQNFPIKAILYELNIPFSREDFPLFNVGVLLENIQDKSYFQEIQPGVIFLFFKTDGAIRGRIEYNTSLYDRTGIERIGGHFKNLMQQALSDANRLLANISILSPEEREQILYDWNGTQKTQPVEMTLHGLIGQSALQAPDKIAIIYRDQAISYRALLERAGQVAARLRNSGIGPDTIVAIMDEHPLESITGILGILTAGSAYLPIDADYPLNRIHYMLADSNAGALLTSKEFIAESKKINQWEGDILAFDGKIDNRFPLATHRSRLPLSTNCLAYVIYTSGTTGRPKGVAVEHASAVNTILSRKEKYDLNSQITALQLFSYAFDGFVTSFFSPMAVNGQVVLMHTIDILDIEKILQTLSRHKVSHFICVPLLFQAILEMMKENEGFSLQVVTLAGDTVSPKIFELKEIKGKTIEIAQEYGVTEAAVMSTILRHQEKKNHTCIGTPIHNTKLYIVNTMKQLQPIGVPGEILIGGKGVARGYINRPELTALRFNANPFENGQRLYCSGDLAQWRPDGNIEFLGRIDHQIKTRGFRVELNEIENQILQFPAVNETVVVAQTNNSSDKQLTAYVVPDRREARLVINLLEKTAREDNGHTLLELPNDMIIFHLNRSETYLMYNDIFEANAYLRHGIHISPGDCIFDVGANIGMFSLFVDSICKGVEIYAFEPLEPLARLLELNLSLYDVNAKVCQYGAASREGDETFTYYSNNSILSGRFSNLEEQIDYLGDYIEQHQISEDSKDILSKEQVNRMLEERLACEKFRCPLKTLSQVIKEYNIEIINLLKITAEKSELDILDGIDGTDWPKIRQLIVQVHDVDGSLGKQKKFLTQRGFRITVEKDPVLQEAPLYNIFAVIPTGQPGTYHEKPLQNPEYWNSPDRLLSRLRTFLGEKLPDYMIPSFFVLMEKLPLTPAGKVDRNALPPLETGMKERYIPPRDEIEAALQEIWAEVLEIEKEHIGIDNDFFELGGHSLKVTPMVSKVRDLLGVTLSFTEIFKTPLIKDLAISIKNLQQSHQDIDSINDDNLVLLKKARAGDKHMFFIHAGSGEIQNYVEFCNHIPPGYHCWAIRSDRVETYVPRNITMEEVAGRYVEKIKKIQTHGPYFIVGWCIGGTIAFEMVRQLEHLGEEVAFFAIINSAPPNERAKILGIQFLFESECQWLLQYLPDAGLEEKIKEAHSIEQLWPMLVDFFEQNRIDVNRIKALIPKEMAAAIPLFDELGLRKLIYYLNLIRSLYNARLFYIPSNPIAAKTYFFGALQEPVKNRQMWSDYCREKIKFYEVEGDHFSIFQLPQVARFVKRFEKNINT
jgi:amino acid adenylation domain-containing protein/FkbM family methyltransferase